MFENLKKRYSKKRQNAKKVSRSGALAVHYQFQESGFKEIKE